jgi:hypothetical protein
MAQLVRILIAIRRAGLRARLDRADDSFIPGRHSELRRHLEFMVRLSSLVADQKVGGNIDLVLSREISPVGERLISANLLRRHRYLYARRRWLKQAAEREPVQGPQTKEVQPAQALPDQVEAPMTSLAVSKVRGDESKPGPSAMAAPSIITSTVPTVIKSPIHIPQGSQPSMTAPSSISSKVVYPNPPKTREGAMFFRCPCCFQTLPVAWASPSRWK